MAHFTYNLDQGVQLIRDVARAAYSSTKISLQDWRNLKAFYTTLGKTLIANDIRLKDFNEKVQDKLKEYYTELVNKLDQRYKLQTKYTNASIIYDYVLREFRFQPEILLGLLRADAELKILKGIERDLVTLFYDDYTNNREREFGLLAMMSNIIRITVKKSRSLTDMYDKDKFLSRVMHAISAKEEYSKCMAIIKSDYQKPHQFDIEKFEVQIEEIRIFSEDRTIIPANFHLHQEQDFDNYCTQILRHLTLIYNSIQMIPYSFRFLCLRHVIELEKAFGLIHRIQDIYWSLIKQYMYPWFIRPVLIHEDTQKEWDLVDWARETDTENIYNAVFSIPTLKCKKEWMNKIYFLRVIAEEVFKKMLDVNDEPIMTLADFSRKTKPEGESAEAADGKLQKKHSFGEELKVNQPHAFCMSIEWFYKICKAIKQNKDMLAEQFYVQPDGKKVPRIEKLDIILKKIDQIDNSMIKAEFNSIGDPKIHYLLVFKPEVSSRLYEKYYSRKKVTNYVQLALITLQTELLSSLDVSCIGNIDMGLTEYFTLRAEDFSVEDVSDIMKYKELVSNLEKLDNLKKENNFLGLYADLAKPFLEDFEKAELEYYALNHRLCVINDSLHSRLTAMRTNENNQNTNMDDDKPRDRLSTM